MRKLLPIFVAFLYSVNSSPLSKTEELYPELGAYFEGDIIAYPGQRSGTPNLQTRWPQGTLVYSIADGFSSRELELIHQAIYEIQKKTCIRFRQGAIGNRIEFTKSTSSSCSSSVGMIGRGKQAVNLASGCFNVGHGTVMHEILHAAGFYHEQSRNDRDNFVRIHTDRIQSNYVGNFVKQKNTLNFGVPYDYGSIMHYPATAFSKESGKVTIEATRSTNGAIMGQRRALTALDIRKVNKMYGC